MRYQTPTQILARPSSPEKMESAGSKNDIKMMVGFKFGEVLWTRIQNMIREYGEEWVAMEDFVDYFNAENKRKNFRPLDTKQYGLVPYFTALDHIFKVRASITDDGRKVILLSKSDVYPQKFGVERKPSSRTPQSNDTRTAVSVINEEHASRANKIETPVRKKVSINEWVKILGDFNKQLHIASRMSYEDYLERLDAFHPGAKGALQMREAVIGEDPIDFIIKMSDKECPIRRFCDGYLIVGNTASYVDKFPYSDALKLRTFPASGVVVAEVSEVDKTGRNLQLYVTLEKDLERRNQLQNKLKDHYRSSKNRISPGELRKGLLCAVPFEGLSDFHRAVIIGLPSDELRVKVLYVDFGTIDKVATAAVCHLEHTFCEEPVFCRPVLVSAALSWPERRFVVEQIMERKIRMNVIGFSKKQAETLVVQVEGLDEYPRGGGCVIENGGLKFDFVGYHYRCRMMSSEQGKKSNC